VILAIDVDYQENSALVAGVSFLQWTDKEADQIFTTEVKGISEYESGSFYKRELPCILKLLEEHELKPEIIVVDGFVFLDGHSKAGLGKYLYDALNGESVVIGVAKRGYKNIDAKYSFCRGESKKPLFVTAEGVAADLALVEVSKMHGSFRIPDLLKKVDQVCRGNN